MKRIILSTSSSGLDYLEKPDNVEVLPLHIILNGQNYLDGKQINFKDMTNMMVQNADLLPETAPTSVEEFLALFKRLYSEGYQEVFILTLSAAMSMTYENALSAKALHTDNMAIHVFDTKTLSYLEATLVLETSKMVEAGKTAFEIKERLDIVRENISFWVVVEDLRNLIKTKRLSAPKGFFANLFDIKPILGIDEEGNAYPIAKVRSIEKALKTMCDDVAEQLKARSGKAFIITTSYDKHLQPLRNLLAQRGIFDVPVVPAASVSIAVHGPYGIGIGVLHDC